MRLAVITAIPTPYRDPFWSEVDAHPDIESLDVYYCALGKPDRPWEVSWEQRFNTHNLPSYNLLSWAGVDASAYWVRGLQQELREGKHDAVIIGGYNHPSMLQAMRGCVARKQPFYVMCETYKRRKTWKSFAKDRLMSYISRHAAGAMPTGKLATEYLASYGMPRGRMIQVPNVPDVRGLIQSGVELRVHAQEIRKASGIPPEGPIATFVGRMIPKKRPMLTLRAFADAAPPNATLVMLGDGPLMPECRELAKTLGLTGRVLFPGFCQPSEVPSYVAIADLFLLPSSETWGVAALEAASLGVRVVLSDEVGCHADLIQSEQLGVVVSAGSQGALTRAIASQLELPLDPATRAAGAAFMKENFAYDTVAKRLVDSISFRDSVYGQVTEGVVN